MYHYEVNVFEIDISSTLCLLHYPLRVPEGAGDRPYPGHAGGKDIYL